MEKYSSGLTEVLRSQGEIISEKTVGNYMREIGINKSN